MAAIEDPALSVETGWREEEALWSGFARLDRAAQVAFAGRALAHLGINRWRIDAVLEGIEEEAKPAVPAVERPVGAAPAAEPEPR